MTDEQIKRDFVANELKSLLVAMNIYVRDCEYIVKGDMEYIKVTRDDDYSTLCNVTGDSLKALTLDVIKKI